MRGAEDHVQPPVRADHGSGLRQLREQPVRQAGPRDDFAVELQGAGIDQTGRRGVRELPRLRSAEPVHQVFRDHQDVGHALEPAFLHIPVPLVERVKDLELAAGPAVELGEGDLLMQLVHDGLCAAVPVGIAGEDLLVAAQQHIIDAPGVHGEADDVVVLREREVDSALHLFREVQDIPDQMAVHTLHAVREAVDFAGLERGRRGCAAFRGPSDDMPAGGRADVDGQITSHAVTSLMR